MYATTRKTRACTLDALDGELKAAIRARGAKYGLEDLESDILMCCETITIYPKKGSLGVIQTTLSAVYVAPKWLVWAESNGRNDVAAGTAQLSEIDVRHDRAATRSAITPEQGLNILGGYTDEDRTGIAFIVLEAQGDGQKFRQVLEEAFRNAAENTILPSSQKDSRK